MTEDEALELLLRQTKTEKNDSNIQAGQAIVRRLGYLPLAIDQAGAYISARKLPLDCFLQQFHERRAAVLQHTPSLWEYRRRLADGTDETPLSVFTTWELSFRHLPRNDTDRGHLRRFLAVAAHFDINGVYEAIFAAYCGSEAELRPKWMELFTSDGGEWDHEKFETAVAELSNLSLLHIVGATGAASFFSLHPLVADWVRLQARREERHSLALEAMGILRTYIDASDFTNMAYIGLARLLSQVDAYLRSGDDYLRSSDAWELAEVRDAAATLAHLYWHSGKVSQSQELYERVMTGCEKALGPDHTSTLVTVNNLGNLYRDQGKLAEAEEMLRRALFGREKALGPDHTSTLNTVHNLGVLYRDQGKLAEAEEMYRRALFGCEKALGPDHTSTLRTVRGLGTLYCNQGKQAQAEAMLSRAVNGLEMALGPDHKSTINALYELGRLYVRQGRHDDGRPLLERAQAGSEKVYGPNHRYTRAAVALLEECLRQPRQPGESATARHARRFCLGFLRT
jgi:tetratricopeptide (TPR) repeat protein